MQFPPQTVKHETVTSTLINANLPCLVLLFTSKFSIHENISAQNIIQTFANFYYVIN